MFLLFFLVCATLCAFGRRCPAEEGQPETTGLPLAVAPVKLDREGIIKELTDFTLAGMNQRLGPDYAHYHPKGPEKPFPDIYLAPAKQGPTGPGATSSAGRGRRGQAITAARKGRCYTSPTMASGSTAL